MSVGVAVGVDVGVSVCVAVGVGVFVAVAVFVGVGVAVSVGVAVAVSVGVGGFVAVAVSVGVGVAVTVGVAVAVFVGVAVAVFVGKGVAVSVALGVFVAVPVGVGVTVDVAVIVAVPVGVGVPPDTKGAPGVTHAGKVVAGGAAILFAAGGVESATSVPDPSFIPQRPMSPVALLISTSLPARISAGVRATFQMRASSSTPLKNPAAVPFVVNALPSAAIVAVLAEFGGWPTTVAAPSATPSR